jgi:hypothetical protein
MLLFDNMLYHNILQRYSEYQQAAESAATSGCHEHLRKPDNPQVQCLAHSIIVRRVGMRAGA